MPWTIGEGYVYTFVRNAGRGSSVFFLCIHEERHEFLDGRHWDVTSIVPCEQGFAFEVEEEDCGGHEGRQNFRLNLGMSCFERV